MKMTLKKIGELADVSGACVSNILNEKSDEYTIETIERVKAIAKKYHYRTNEIAKSMRTKETLTLGLIIPDITNPYYPELARGVEDKALELGYNIIYLNSDEDPVKEKNAFRVLEQKMVDGVIFIPSVNFLEHKDIIKHFPVPIVAVDKKVELKELSEIKGMVVANDYKGSRDATKFLLNNGYEKILFLSGDYYWGINSDRTKGFCDELTSRNISIGKDYIEIGNHAPEFGYRAVSDFLKKNNKVEAVYAGSDMIAIGALQALHNAGLRVPEDVALLGYDDIYMSQYMIPSLTTVSQPKYEMGVKGIEMLVDLINKKGEEMKHNVTIDPKLIIRQSVRLKAE